LNIPTEKEINVIIDKILTDKIFGENFKFREHQRETILKIVLAFFDNEIDNVILSMSTGGGKSLIALFTGHILSFFNKSGYVLTNQKMLQDQYETDIRKFNISAETIKGIDNYQCHINNEPFSLGICKTHNLKSRDMPCYDECEYIQRRNKASLDDIAILNYNYWLIQLNYVYSRFPAAPFNPRDYTFFDEAHFLGGIVQSHFSPALQRNFLPSIDFINMFLNVNGFDNNINIEKIQNIMSILITTEDNIVINNQLKNLENELSVISESDKKFKARMKKKFPFINIENKKLIPKDWKRMSKLFDYIKDVNCKIEDFNKISLDSGIENIVKQYDKKENSLILNYLKERYLVHEHAIKQSNFRMFMSATIGDIDTFIYKNGLDKDNTLVIELDDTFQYKQSPIFMLDGHYVNYKNKLTQIPRIIKKLDVILEGIEKDTKGIIHTASYENTKLLLEFSKHKNRMIRYTDSNDKQQALEKFEKSENGILIGPSISTGLDLKDNLSRFQMFIKVPFPHLGNKLVKAKFDIDKESYQNDTLIEIQQALGRSIRSNTDWARSYMFDSNFIRIMHTKGIGKGTRKRFMDMEKLLIAIIQEKMK